MKHIIPIILALAAASANAGCRLQKGNDFRFDGGKQ